MSNIKFDVCIIAGRESKTLDSYIEENLKDLKVIQCYNFPSNINKYYKTNFCMTSEEELEFESYDNFKLGYYENIINNSEFIFFHTNNCFEMYYTIFHMGIAIGLNKPIFLMDKEADKNKGRFTSHMHNLFNKTWTNNETERKWLISEEIYNILTSMKMDTTKVWIPEYISKITQFVDNNNVRYRKQKSSRTPQYIKCIKSNKDDFTRFEIESVINADIYEKKLQEFKESSKYGSVINKERSKYVFKYPDLDFSDALDLELNKHKIGGHYFYTVEIEYRNKNQVTKIGLTDILDVFQIKNKDIYEFTNSKELNNKTIMKLNARKKTDIQTFSEYVNGLCNNCFTKVKTKEEVIL